MTGLALIRTATLLPATLLPAAVLFLTAAHRAIAIVALALVALLSTRRLPSLILVLLLVGHGVSFTGLAPPWRAIAQRGAARRLLIPFFAN